MKPFPFTKEGVQQLIDYLYALPQEELNASIQDLQTGYISWLRHHLDLNPEQVDQLASLSVSFLCVAQQQIVLALQMRMSIRLEKETTPLASSRDSKPGVGKFHGIDFGFGEKQAEKEAKGTSDGIPENRNNELIYKIWYKE